MRVVDIFLFALAFHVASIVCAPPPIPNPNPPYKVVRMSASYLPDVYVECEVKRPGSVPGNFEYCEVQGSLDVVIKGDTVIGHVNHKDELVPIRNKDGQLFQKLKLGSNNPETMYSGEAGLLGRLFQKLNLGSNHPEPMSGREDGEVGMWRKLPENTIYVHPVKKGAPPPHRMIIHKDVEGNVLYTELVPWQPWRMHLVRSSSGRYVFEPR